MEPRERACSVELVVDEAASFVVSATAHVGTSRLATVLPVTIVVGAHISGSGAEVASIMHPVASCSKQARGEPPILFVRR